ncbi:MAG TPA: hypothetical protein VJH24_04390 [Candidatus Bilamarchaeaceae archaeon]|nr:hypothetical protein [Candidatus Bilamarchaeaceae archaeon]
MGKRKKGSLDEEIKTLHAQAVVRVNKSLKAINIALKLNASKLKQKTPPSDLTLLQKWKEALEYWKDEYEEKNETPEAMAESLGAFYEICTGMR